ncbi:hypothetical protein PYCCODRAFT_566403 [Trametes coccinea BRFM310]|uniref:Uncharacterized protein n=1 Tax=Trametes coccinea (strain BRFM310) TaxID=1353009 RepID=A0A1Y2IIP5_TRAC3|nr:hypothetical protein PYCCODRAFT_566403 [Trametes coccinea BRFM310]
MRSLRARMPACWALLTGHTRYPCRCESWLRLQYTTALAASPASLHVCSPLLLHPAMTLRRIRPQATCRRFQKYIRFPPGAMIALSPVLGRSNGRWVSLYRAHSLRQ